jgi:hypothetical protein
MSRRAGKRTMFAALLVAGALLIPASPAAAGAQIGTGDGPVAHKSGAIVNYTSTAKLRVKKHMRMFFVCNVNCSVTSTTTIKGLGGKLTRTVSGDVPAGIQGFVEITPKGSLPRLLKRFPGRFRFINKITATDPTTGATDNISHTFKLKR